MKEDAQAAAFQTVHEQAVEQLVHAEVRNGEVFFIFRARADSQTAVHADTYLEALRRVRRNPIDPEADEVEERHARP